MVLIFNLESTAEEMLNAANWVNCLLDAIRAQFFSLRLCRSRLVLAYSLCLLAAFPFNANSGRPLSPPPSKEELVQIELSSAIHKRDFALMEAAIRRGARLSDGIDRLSIPARLGDSELVSWLLKHGANPNPPITGHSSGVPLYEAVEKGQLSTAVLLIEGGANVNARHGSRTPLLLAIASRNEEIARRLVSAGANPNLEGEPLEFPLAMSLAIGATDLARDLIRKGADIRALSAFPFFFGKISSSRSEEHTSELQSPC